MNNVSLDKSKAGFLARDVFVLLDISISISISILLKYFVSHCRHYLTMNYHKGGFAYTRNIFKMLCGVVLQKDFSQNVV